MSFPDFRRAEYLEPRVIEGEVAGKPLPRGDSALPLALVYGIVAALLGGIVYGLVASMGFMISIVAVGIGWLVARAMMTATGGTGGRSYQIAATLLTYFAVTFGNLVHPVWVLHQRGMPTGQILASPLLLRYLLLGPFLELSGGLSSINALLGLLILFFGLRTAWTMAAGSPGFGGSGPRRVRPFGPR